LFSPLRFRFLSSRASHLSLYFFVLLLCVGIRGADKSQMVGGEAGIVGVVEDQLPEALLRQQPEAIRIVTKGGGPPVAGGMLKF
jgi:hypothetical protein